MRLAFVCILATATPALADDYLPPSAAPMPPAPAPAVATTQPLPHKTLGIDGAAILPIGDYADAATAGAGVFARLEIPLRTGGFVTARLGVIGHAMQDDVMASLYLVPAYVGYCQPVGTGGAYIAGELGITFGYASANTQFGTVSDSDSELGFTLTAGMRRGALDVRAGLFAPDADDVHGIMGSLGFDFAAL